MKTRSASWKTTAAVALMALAPVEAGCQPAGGGASVPSCPPGWSQAGDGSCLISGTLKPGQQLPLPTEVPQGASVRPQ